MNKLIKNFTAILTGFIIIAVTCTTFATARILSRGLPIPHERIRAAACESIFGCPGTFLQIGRALPEGRKLSSKLGEHFRRAGNLPPNWESISDRLETLLLSAGSFQNVWKSSCRQREHFKMMDNRPAACRSCFSSTTPIPICN